MRTVQESRAICPILRCRRSRDLVNLHTRLANAPSPGHPRGMTVAQPALAPPRITSRPSPDGGLILRSEMPLEPYEASLGMLLRRWAAEAPDRTFLAERAGEDWRTVTWSQADDAASSVAQALLDRG